MKTQNEIEALKRNWKSDPIWDIEETEGFEGHREELREFRLIQEQEMQATRFNRLLLKSEGLGVRGNIKLADCVEQLEHRLKSLEERVSFAYGGQPYPEGYTPFKGVDNVK